VRTIGLLGGMSWTSTIEYYRIINEEAARRLGGLHAGRIIVNSVDFGVIARMQREGDWQGAGELLAEAAVALERAGADLLLIGAVTMHIVSDAVERAAGIPLLHIADVTAERMMREGIASAGLLGTLYTMEQDFLKQRLASRGLRIHVPNETDRQHVHRIIFEELAVGRILAHSREQLLDVIGRLSQQGAEAVILGCTELSLLLRADDSPIPAFDTTRIHALAAVNMALA
jgi:aspartate racemase